MRQIDGADGEDLKGDRGLEGFKEAVCYSSAVAQWAAW